MSNAVLQLKVSLKGAKPPIWRRLQVHSDVTLDELHTILQAAFTWYGGHLHVFETAEGSFSDPQDDVEYTSSEIGVRLTRMVGLGERLSYTYDFGDDWEHVIVVEKRVPALDGVTYPRCTGGRRAAPPEDCGGIWAYESLLEMHTDPELAKQADEREQYELSVMATDFDPAAFDPETVNRRLARMAGD